MERFAKKTLLPHVRERSGGKNGVPELERNLSRELDSPRPAASQERIADANIARGCERQERCSRRKVSRETPTIGVEPVGRGIRDEIRKIGIGKIGVVEEVEEVDVKLEIQPFRQSRFHVDTEIELFERRPAQRVAPQVAEVASASSAVAVTRGAIRSAISKSARHLEVCEIDTKGATAVPDWTYHVRPVKSLTRSRVVAFEVVVELEGL